MQVKSPKELNEDSRCDSATVYLEGTNVQGSAVFVRSDLCGISMTGAHVSRHVELLGSRLALFDFSGSNAEGDLQIGPSRGLPGRLPVWLPPFGAPPVNLVLSHSSVAAVRVALKNWQKMCYVGVKPEDRKGKCAPPRNLKVEPCRDIHLRPSVLRPSDLPDHDNNFFGVSKNEPTTIVVDFDSKLLGNLFTAHWMGMI